MPLLGHAKYAPRFPFGVSATKASKKSVRASKKVKRGSVSEGSTLKAPKTPMDITRHAIVWSQESRTQAAAACLHNPSEGAKSTLLIIRNVGKMLAEHQDKLEQQAIGM